MCNGGVRGMMIRYPKKYNELVDKCDKYYVPVLTSFLILKRLKKSKKLMKKLGMFMNTGRNL